jgi:EAL domain-containing protein (putative c-di-GMP-specific phosphodiesterase class I)
VLKSLGVHLAVDDFGTGYSSLSSLHNLPVDTLKIDKTFIDGVTTGAEGAGVVDAIIGLARTLHLGTVAEGVEHHDQVRRLGELGCQQLQGYCFSKPLPAAEIVTLLDRFDSAAA